VAKLILHLRRQAVAYLALFVALSGTTYAAVNLPNHSVTGKKIARKTIKAGNLKTNAVNARAIRADAVRGDEVLESSLGTVPSAADAAKLGGSTLGQVRSGIDAAKLGGSDLAQVRSGIDAAALGGTPRSGFYSSSDVDARLPRAAEQRSGGETNFSTGNPVDRISVQLTAPRAGFAFVAATANVHPLADITVANHHCAVEISVPEIPQVGRVGSLKTGDSSIDYELLAATWIVPVDAGTHTFTLRLGINSFVSANCSDQIAAGSSTIDAIWLPAAG
jgi:hypothetical protein